MDHLQATGGSPLLAGFLWLLMACMIVNSPKFAAALKQSIWVCCLMALLPLVTRLTRWSIQAIDPGYGDYECFLFVVNSTNSEHYVAHPVWRFIDPACELSTEQFIARQYGNTWETELFTLCLFAFVLVAIGTTLKLMSSRGLRAVPDLMLLCLATERIAVEIMAFGHIVADVFQPSHTIMHHVPTWGGVGAESFEGLEGQRVLSQPEGTNFDCSLNRQIVS